jgi:nucleoside-diphosphate-sugar epimerase
MRIVVIGGTKFLGRAAVNAARAAGHELTLVNRGQTNAELFPEIEQIHLDLRGDLDALTGRTWDAAIDLDPTQLPRQTRRRAEALDAGHYVFVSTISVYSDPSAPIDESSPVLEPPDPEPEEFDPELYGGLKTGSERALLDVLGDRAAIVRAGLIVGPNDPTERFTYWPRRLAEGGRVLAPGNPSQQLQLIDARDLGAFLVRLAENRVAGVFNATGPAEPVTLGAVLERIAPGADLVWVDDETLVAAEVVPWTELPLWLPGEENAGLMQVDISRALAAGLRFRPLQETARDTLAWSRAAGEQRLTLSREKERELLARRGIAR